MLERYAIYNLENYLGDSMDFHDPSISPLLYVVFLKACSSSSFRVARYWALWIPTYTWNLIFKETYVCLCSCKLLDKLLCWKFPFCFFTNAILHASQQCCPSRGSNLHLSRNLFFESMTHLSISSRYRESIYEVWTWRKVTLTREGSSPTFLLNDMGYNTILLCNGVFVFLRPY